MKQLLIVNSAKALNAGASTPKDLSGLQEGAIAFFELGAASFLAAAPSKNFGIALGRPNGQAPFIISEVDAASLQITKALPQAGVTFSAVFTVPTTVVGQEYSVLVCKKGVVFNERNVYTSSIVAKTTTAATEAARLVTEINAKTSENFPITASNSGAAITITAKNAGEDFEIKFADGLADVSLTSITHGKAAYGDAASIAELARQCAAGKGYNYLSEDGKELYPNFPEAVEALVPNTSGNAGASTAGYAVITLRFMVGRDASKTRDEKVWQLVHIAIPITATSYSAVNTILPEGTLQSAANAALAARVTTLEG